MHKTQKIEKNIPQDTYTYVGTCSTMQMTTNNDRKMVLHCFFDTTSESTTEDHDAYSYNHQTSERSFTNLRYECFTKRLLLLLCNRTRPQKRRRARKRSSTKKDTPTQYTYKQITLNKNKDSGLISSRFISHNFSPYREIMASKTAKRSQKDAKKRRDKALCQCERSKHRSQDANKSPEQVQRKATSFCFCKLYTLEELVCTSQRT